MRNLPQPVTNVDEPIQQYARYIRYADERVDPEAIKQRLTDAGLAVEYNPQKLKSRKQGFYLSVGGTDIQAYLHPKIALASIQIRDRIIGTEGNLDLFDNDKSLLDIIDEEYPTMPDRSKAREAILMMPIRGNDPLTMLFAIELFKTISYLDEDYWTDNIY